MTKKKRGAFYTPSYLADFIVEYLFDQYEYPKKIKILEPSMGDGVFLKSLSKKHIVDNFEKMNISLIEKNKYEYQKVKKYCEQNVDIRVKTIITNLDFLKYQNEIKEKFDLIIGNPPYIKRNYLTKKQKEYGKGILNFYNLNQKNLKNIWLAFLLSSVSLLNQKGILAFILPAEFMQVKYTNEIRELLISQFDRLEVLKFTDLMFECKGQDTLLLIACKSNQNKGVYRASISKKDIINKRKIKLIENVEITNSNIKGIHQLNSDEVELLMKFRNGLNKIRHYCSSKPGVVTAANSYFIINEEISKEYCLSKFTKEIIQKGIFVNGSVVFTNSDYKKLSSLNKPSLLLDFNNYKANNGDLLVKKYLKIGIDKDITSRYKCRLRDNWYQIPNLPKPPEGFFFKRSHLYPKLLKNSANVLVTDSAYMIKMNEAYSLNSLIYSFYNTLTLLFAELEGRFYGGGVLELTPNEFKNLPMPYMNIAKRDFEDFRIKFENKKNIEEICKVNDNIILKNAFPDITKHEIERLAKIKKKLIHARMKRFD